MSPWVALLRMEVRAKLRERWLWSMLVLTPLLAAAAPFLISLPDAFTSALEARLVSTDGDDEEPVIVCVADDPGLPTAALLPTEPGEEPLDWLSYPGGWTAPDEADVLVDRLPGSPPTLRVMALAPDVVLEEVDDCLWDDVYIERGERLEALGISERPGLVTRVQWLAPALEAGAGPSIVGRELAAAGLIAGLLFGTSLIVDLLPRRRRTGLLEMLRGTRATGRDLVLSVVVIAGVANLVGTLLMGLGLGVSTWLLGSFRWPEVPWALGPAWVGMLATAVPVFGRLSDLRAAALSLLALYFGWIGLAGGTLALVDTSPWLAALVPLGGPLVACVLPLGAGPTALASLVTVLAGGALLLWAADGFDREEHSGGTLDATLMRRARGRFGPEVAVLFLASLGGATLVMSALATQEWPALILSQVAFLLVPAIVTPYALGLEPGHLLPLRRPDPMGLLGAPVVGVGLIGTSTMAMGLAMLVLPVNAEVLEIVTGGISDLAGGLGMLLIGLVPAICEEALFRGAIYGLLRKRLAPWPAILVQAALFAVFHVFPFRWAPTFVSGVALGWLRERTGSLWIPAAVHMSVNCGIALLMWSELDLQAHPEWIVGMAAGLLVLPFYRAARPAPEPA